MNELFTDESVYTVSDVNALIKGILSEHSELRNIQIIGEISNFKCYPSGHCYFTMKDAGGVLKCVMFRSKAMHLRFEPRNGDTVLAVGRIEVYERDGVYQLYTDLLMQQGLGDLMQAYERLKKRLEAEGLFAADRKRELTLNPHTVGIITSPAGAAVRDIITVSRRRNPGVKLLLFPVKVQGEGSAAEVARAIKFFNKHKLADVLIVGRGGGSIEELWAFNEETAVRAVAASKIPVISAVGHETDFTLCDFAADRRAATPSQAAELAVPDVEGYKRHVLQLNERMRNALTNCVTKLEHRLERLRSSYVLQDPERLFASESQRVDTAYSKLVSSMEALLRNQEHAFQLQAAKLDGLSPLSVLGRGYSVTQNAKNKVITSTEQVTWGDELVTTVADGAIISVVQNIERRES